MKINRILSFVSTVAIALFLICPICNASESEKLQVEGDRTSKNKIIYLTFDDGPTRKNTPKILETLKEEDVPATFFLIGEKVKVYEDVVKELKDQGMAIGAHSYSHVTSKIYKSAFNYREDLEKCIDVIKEVTGEEPINITRMPCGSTNTIANINVKREIKRSIKSMGMNYVDWNVSGEDAIYRNVPSNVIWKNIMKNSKDKDTIVLLLHDGYYNTNTAQLLPKIIKHFKKEGYTFKTMKNMPQDEIESLEKLRILNRK